MMRIGLIAEKTIDRDLDHNFSRMKAWLQRCAGTGFELLCFGEAFAHGFEALSWNHEQDLAIALERDDTHILDLGAQARQAGTGIAFGYIEKAGEKLYSSYMVIPTDGEALIN
ncbi:MAG TPA: nitrilase-related carbon-nitrogen hydrolase, partial [Anaerolineaceae bacterium]|nr:nitrilase-related carbon-nitrogen hydrolase [Anaerolineaceae bacterium]